MNKPAVFRSYWEGGIIESDCEVTPLGGIVNIESVEPPIPPGLVFTAPDDILIKETGQVFTLSEDLENEPVIDDNNFEPFCDSHNPNTSPMGM